MVLQYICNRNVIWRRRKKMWCMFVYPLTEGWVKTENRSITKHWNSKTLNHPKEICYTYTLFYPWIRDFWVKRKTFGYLALWPKTSWSENVFPWKFLPLCLRVNSCLCVGRFSLESSQQRWCWRSSLWIRTTTSRPAGISSTASSCASASWSSACRTSKASACCAPSDW